MPRRLKRRKFRLTSKHVNYQPISNWKLINFKFFLPKNFFNYFPKYFLLRNTIDWESLNGMWGSSYLPNSLNRLCFNERRSFWKYHRRKEFQDNFGEDQKSSDSKFIFHWKIPFKTEYWSNKNLQKATRQFSIAKPPYK